MVTRVAFVTGAGSPTGIGARYVSGQSIVVDGGSTIREIKGVRR
jgi:NAD(P)-dependent dehydrogenase (short-subunit alcohol dehydrogenase family)